MESKKLKLNVKSTKDLYKAAVSLLNEINGERDSEELGRAVTVWLTTAEFLDYVIEQFIAIQDSEEREIFLNTFIAGVDSLPDELSESDVIPRGIYNKNNLPQA